MSRPLRVLIVEDSENDTLLMLRELRRGGYDPVFERVDTAGAMKAAFEQQEWDVVLADYSMPHFSGLAALELYNEKGLDLPFIIVSGVIGEETAVAAMKGGAHDYLMKDKLARLVPAIERELRDAEVRRQRKRAEEALKGSEQRFRSLSENAPDIIFTLGLDGRLTYVNPAFEKVLGYEREEGLGKYFVAFAMEVDEENYVNLFKRIRDGKEIIRDMAVMLIHKDGSARLFNFCGAPNIDTAGEVTGIVGLLKDITENRRLEAQFQQAQKMEAIGILSGDIANDFNNMLMGVLGKTSLMLLGIDPSHPHYKGLMSIERLIERGVKLTRRLLGYATTGGYEVKPIDLNRLVQETSETFGRTKKEIVIHRELAEDLSAIEGDQGQIEQVLLNLFVNAADAMPDGGDLILKTMNTTRDAIAEKFYDPQWDKYVLLTVTDTGKGMDEETMEHIFDPFFTTKRAGQGTGLGLASAYNIIKGHDGYIEAESTKGYRTTFRIYLPASEKGVEKVAEPVEELIRGTETVLIVDDEEAVLEVSKELLEALGYMVLTAKDGREAIDVYRTNMNDIDIVLLDMVMPRMGGGKVYDRMKQINPNVTVVLSSGYSMRGEATDILNRGCNGFIQKPFTMRELSGKIREVLDKR